MSIHNLTGYTLGQYELRDLLGVGGMGAVYRGYQTSLDREVAVKILPTALAEQAGYVERFNREARIAASLEHAHIVRVYDFGTQDSISYLVMQLLKGGTLAQRIARHPDSRPSLAETAYLLDQLTSALDYAHSRGVVHRDIKPSNIMFDAQGNAHIMDFGIARLLEATSTLTSRGLVVGTWAYMAPEQWKAEDLTPATDQYALGVMTYALVTGRMPFEAATPPGIMHKHLNERPVPPHHQMPDVPEALTPILERALAKQPADRFPSTTEFAQTFRQAVGRRGGQQTQFFTAPIERPLLRPEPARTPSSSQPAAPLATTAERPIYRHPVTWLLSLFSAVMAVVLIAVLLGLRDQGAAGQRVALGGTTLTGEALSPTPESPSSTPAPAASPTDMPTMPSGLIILPSPTLTGVHTPTRAPSRTVMPTKTPAPPTGTYTASATVATVTPPPTDTHTPIATESATATRTATATQSTTPEPSSTPRPALIVFTNTPVPSDTPSLTPVPTDTQTPTLAESSTPTDTPTATATASPSPRPTDPHTPTLTKSPTLTETATATVTPSSLPLPTSTPEPTADVAGTLAAAVEATLAARPSATPYPTYTPIPTLTPTDTPRPTLTPAIDLTGTRAADEAAQAALQATLAALASVAPSPTASPTVPTPTVTPSPQPSLTPTPSPTPGAIQMENMSGLRKEILIPDSKTVRGAVFDPADSVLCYFVNRSSQLELLDIGKGFQPRLPLYTQGTVHDIDLSPDGRDLAAATAQGIVIFKNFMTELNPSSVVYSAPGIYSLAYSLDGQKLYALGSPGNLYSWNITGPDEPETLRINYDSRSAYRDLQLIMGGDYLLMSKGTTVEMRAADAWNSIPFRTSMAGNITSKVFSDQYRLLAITDDDGSINVWQFDERGPSYGATVLYREYHGSWEYERAVVAMHPLNPVVAIRSRSGLTLLDFSDPKAPVKSETNRELLFSNPTLETQVFGFSATGHYLAVQGTLGLEIWLVPWYAPKIQALTEAGAHRVKGIVVSSQSINVRNQPSQTARILGQLNPGDEVTVVGRNEDSSWLQILHGASRAWVAAFLLRVEGDVTALPQLGDDQAVQTTLRFTGTLYDLTSNTAVPSAYVTVKDYAVSGMTDGSGAFELQSVPAGEQPIIVQALYHQMPYGPLQYWFDPTKNEIIRDILMLPGEPVKARIRLYKENTVTVLPHALVRLRRLDTMAVVGEFATDVNGFTQPLTLPRGPYLLEVTDQVNQYYSIIVFKLTSEDDESTPVLTSVLQIFEPLETRSASASTGGMTVVAALTAEQCRSTRTTLFAATAYDLDTGRLLAHEQSASQRILLNFDTSETSGRCVVRYDAICSAGWQLDFDVLPCEPGANLEIAVTRYLVSARGS
ncbi:MAG: protein kinase [Anaerolineae bacterium]|nr:protein kinase [Anaerolineae bacterium]